MGTTCRLWPLAAGLIAELMHLNANAARPGGSSRRIGAGDSVRGARAAVAP